ncbi:MAG: GAF domain-containing protein [Elusimicrobiota bacterium]|nr:GAF domain-containing protein [Elusimicrobiota bacterium]
MSKKFFFNCEVDLYKFNLYNRVVMALLKLKFIASYILIGLFILLVSSKFHLSLGLSILLLIGMSIIVGFFITTPIAKLFAQFQKLVNKITSGYLKLRADITSIDLFENVFKSLDRALNGFTALIDISRELSKQTTLDKLLKLIIEQGTNLMNAERTTLFLYNKDTHELWSYIAQELEIKEIRLPVGKGIAGYVAKSGKILNIKDAYKDSRFENTFDRLTGFRTRNILCSPMFNHQGELLGVIEVINKKTSDFNEYDESILAALASQAGIAIENTKLYESQQNLFRSFIKTIAAVIDARDPATRGHSERVARYSLAIGKVMNLTDEQLKILEYAAILHDVGKISIPDAVLLKPGQFTPEEYEVIKRHAIYTREILDNIYSSSEFRDVPLIAASHHEKLDGSGYPYSLSSADIGTLARIIAIADVYDALVSYDRPYKPAMSQEKAIEIIKDEASKNKLDPEIVKLFIEKKLYQLERREYVRISAEFSIEYRILSPEEWRSIMPLISKTKDISASGLLFERPQPLPVNSYLEVSLYIHQFTINLIVKVVRCAKLEDKFRIGITFVNINPDVKKQIAKYLSEIG